MDAILDLLSYFFWLALALGVLVFVHELGHFLAARLFGMRVDAFSLGFPPNVIAKKVGEVEYRLGAVPLGGYVKIAGMVDESLDVPYEMEPVLDADGMQSLDDDGQPLFTPRRDERGKKIPAEPSVPEPDEYRSKPVWQRIIVISAGVIFNFVLAFLIYSALAFSLGQRYTPAENVALSVVEGSIASEMGFRDGDRIAAVNGEEVEAFEDVISPSTFSSDTLRVTVVRDGERVELTGPDQIMTRLGRAEREAPDGSGFDTIFGIAPRMPAAIGGVESGSPADEAGIAPGDIITTIGGRPITTWDEIPTALAAAGDTVLVRWTRPDSLAATEPAADIDEDAPRAGDAGGTYQALVVPDQRGDARLLGVRNDPDALGSEYESLGFGQALAAGWSETVGLTGAYVNMVGKLVTGRENFRENVGGPLIIMKQSKEAADRGGASFWNFVAFLSIALAVFNILPIPALDGGHLVFLLYEGVTRREPSLRVKMVVQQIGIALILMLMVFVIFNDAVNWFIR